MKVAVYGTLRQGCGNHRLLNGSKFLGTTKTAPEYTMYLAGCPYVTHGGDTAITVEVYEVNDYTLARLDILEGHPTFYNRQLIDTEFGPAWMYFIDDDYNNPQNLVANGDYMG